MGHRTYLIRTKADKTSGDLFEANNSIPFFWLTLIDHNTIEQSAPEMRRLFHMTGDEQEAYTENHPGATRLRISKQNFISNASAAKPFIVKYLPDRVRLYEDFIKYLDMVFASGDTLELSLIEMANFDDVDTLIESLEDEVSAIKSANDALSHYLVKDKGDTPVFSGITGYDRYLGDKFKEYSEDYRVLCDKEDERKGRKRQPPTPVDPKGSAGSKIVPALVLLIGIVGLIGCCKGFMKEGLTGKVIACTAFSLFVAAMAVRRLVK